VSLEGPGGRGAGGTWRVVDGFHAIVAIASDENRHGRVAGAQEVRGASLTASMQSRRSRRMKIVTAPVRMCAQSLALRAGIGLPCRVLSPEATHQSSGFDAAD